MGKYFSASTRHAKAFLELRQGMMTVLDYVAKFTELARFGDDYVATDVAKIRKFEDGLKLSIRGKIIGHNIQDMDSMVSTALIIDREVDDARSIRETGSSDKKRGSHASSSSSGKKKRTSFPREFQGRGCSQQGQSQVRVTNLPRQMTCFHYHQRGHMRRN